MSSTTPAMSTVMPTREFTTNPVDAEQSRAYSTRELQAAASALAAGLFAPSQTGAALAEPGPGVTGVVAMLGPLVRVRAANAGAGASTIALALADAADGAGLRTRVLDAAAPDWSGLIGASVTELGAKDGWRCGRRGAGVLIDRVETNVRIPGSVPVPREVDGVDITVLDTGWTTRELEASQADADDCWVASAPAHAEVVVTRPTILALGQAEALIADLAGTPVVVVVVGAGRWTGPEFAAAGPRLRRLQEDQGLVFVPPLPVKTLPGLGPEPLPKQLMSAAQRLLDRITVITGPLHAGPA